VGLGWWGLASWLTGQMCLPTALGTASKKPSTGPLLGDGAVSVRRACRGFTVIVDALGICRWVGLAEWGCRAAAGGVAGRREESAMSDTAQGSWAGSRFGPTLAAYGLFRGIASLKDAFNGFTGTVAIVSCPGGKASPGTSWHNSNPSDILGPTACGTYKDTCSDRSAAAARATGDVGQRGQSTVRPRRRIPAGTHPR
jgi:hypothetical protein